MHEAKMTTDTVSLAREHYQSFQKDTDLVATVKQILETVRDGKLGASQLAGMDQFHVMGLGATKELAELAGIGPEMKVLDAGSGLGGPARVLAETYGCRVTGVDLTPSFVEVSTLLAERTGLNNLVSFEVGDLTKLSFPDETFDAVWTQHVVMNITERSKVYRELRRVLKAGGILAFYDPIAADEKLEPFFPVPWAEESAASFLQTKAETIDALHQAGFEIRTWSDVTAEALSWFEQQRSSPPNPLSLTAAMGPRMTTMVMNLARNVREGRVRLAMGIANARHAS